MNKSSISETGKTVGDTAAAKSAGAADAPPTVLQVVPELVTGGVERGTIDIAQALAAAGARAIVASAGGPMETALSRAGAVHFTLPTHSKNVFVMVRNIRRLQSIIEEHNVDIVHARSRAPAWSAYIAARRTGRPFVTTFHGTYGAQNALKRWYNRVMTRGVRTIAISQFIANHVRNTYGLDPAKLVVIHRGVDLDIFDPKAVAPGRFIPMAQNWRLPDGVPVVMLPGRLTRWKGQQVFIDAIARLGRKDICAVMLGSDQGRVAYREELEDQIRDKDLGGVLRLVEQTSDMPAALMLADVVVSASTDPEAFGRIIAEAGAMGRPVIATDHGGAQEQVIEGETGWLVPPGDVDALAAAIERAVTLDKAKREQMSAAAIEQVRGNFSRAAMCEATLALYREVAAEAGRGPR
ncbi:MAG: glycosyltransferase family 4 protein [Alphaproteobacteria bacterium]|nr:glycosyltransferase family 4 protein [Alphaproteobacteria bacterium]